ncbi:MAG: hypothetical protein DI539_09810, partial [Flavobacterium psychrophilum]
FEDVSTFFSINKTDSYSYYELLMEAARPKATAINVTAMLNYFKDNQTRQKVPFKVLMNGIYFIHDGKKIAVREMECNALIDMEFADVALIEKSYRKMDQEIPKATTVSFDLDENVTGSIVLDKDEKLHFFDTTGKGIKKMEVLLELDKESGQFKKPAKP